MYDIKNFSAIVNPPQSAILAVGKAQSKALVKNGQIVAGTTMELTLSCDHRVVDGAVGARFLKEFKNYIENPITMFI
jgi:pyruvate dehydrogenase E2 component (dihydrolipoamide acetyltransferase)